ncbi:DCC1-like thiol-disulfide oxidoreductase family protein [uncultured Shimia sp.]|uniref:thiol-disulfide oxidoreductase DCC family protein n=1 Tax=uncultured Shimia sp. TaxID=573152 RepID=UPI0025DF0314|nr:DCC1-like thiol-disulfide oxidoreductase family protein [uncultured Shimia sp.]
MAQLIDRPSYSYRTDPDVPEFDDTGPITVMDGDCALCGFGARMIARFDTHEDFRICPGQTDLGTALLGHFGMKPEDPESWLLILDGRAYGSLDAIIRVGQAVGGVGHGLRVLRVLPRGLQDWIYRRIARNRYAMFGRGDMCALPDERLKARLLLK